MFPHAFRESSHADGSEEVDAETCIARIFRRENACKYGLQGVFLHPISQLFHAEALC